MPRPSSNQPVLSSLLDRLIEPGETGQIGAGGRGAGQSIRQLKQNVRRDLENLLNTRWRCKSWPPNLDSELEYSLINYGIPDFSAANLGAVETREEFRKILQRVIEKFEPRFQKVKVTVVGSADALDRTLRFRIDGVLRADPLPEPVQFDTAIEPATHNIVVKRADR